MRFYNKVIVRRGKKWQIGVIKRMKFVPEKTLDGIGDITERYIPLSEYTILLGYDYTKKQVNDIRKKIGYTEIRVLDRPCRVNKKTDDIADRTWETYFFKFTNALCNKCVNDCKQSSRISITHCPDYKKDDK